MYETAPRSQPDHPLFSNTSLYAASTWILPLVIAITFHEAAHGFVAHHFGDETAWKLGRVTLNPLKHIDPFGTLLLPALLLFTHSPFLFGYAKPVPVNFRALGHPRRDMVFVAAAGPATNIVLATLAAAAFHLIAWAPADAAPWIFDNLKNALVINVVLAIFNLIPIPPLDGSRVLRYYLSPGAEKVYDQIGMFGIILVFFVAGRFILPIFYTPLLAIFDAVLVRL